MIFIVLGKNYTKTTVVYRGVYMNNLYSSEELMKIFNIKKGSWDKIKKKYHLNSYAIKDGKYFYYNSDAYNLLKEHIIIDNTSTEDKKENNFNKNTMLMSLQYNKLLEKQVLELQEQNNIFKNYYESEKQKNEQLFENNTNLLLKTKELENKINLLENRSFLQRLFNKKF